MNATYLSRRVALAGAAGLFLLGGCAGPDGPERGDVEAAVARAETAVAVASNTETDRYAPSELAIAQEKLLAARQSLQAEKYAAADRLLTECLVNLQLARAKADSARMRDELRRMGARVPEQGTAQPDSTEAPQGPDRTAAE